MDRNEQREESVPVSARAPWSGLQLDGRRAYKGLGLDLITEPRLFGRQIKEVLFVDPSLEWQRTAQKLLRSIAIVDVCSTFLEACERLISRPPDLLVTSVRLQAHNGLHLVYLAAGRAPSTRCVVHVTAEDFPLAREVEKAGAFLVRAPWLPVALQSYATATLPPRDRRDVGTVDRRRTPRGGRRCTDS